MGNTQPTNKTGRKVTAQKLENAKKTGILSLSGHALDTVPSQVFNTNLQEKLRTLDLSKNNLVYLGKIETLLELKSFNVDHNKLVAGSLVPVQFLTKLQNLSASGNLLGKPVKTDPSHPKPQDPLPTLPNSLRQINLSDNFLATLPPSLMSPSLVKLTKLDLSNNQLATLPEEISNLTNLEDLNLDNNMIVSLPESLGSIATLKVLSLRRNQIRVTTNPRFHPTSNPQPIPASVFTRTRLIDLNLHENPLTNTQLNEFEGFSDFLARREEVKKKTNNNLSLCGLD